MQFVLRNASPMIYSPLVARPSPGHNLSAFYEIDQKTKGHLMRFMGVRSGELAIKWPEKVLAEKSPHSLRVSPSGGGNFSRSWCRVAFTIATSTSSRVPSRPESPPRLLLHPPASQRLSFSYLTWEYQEINYPFQEAHQFGRFCLPSTSCRHFQEVHFATVWRSREIFGTRKYFRLNPRNGFSETVLNRRLREDPKITSHKD